MKLVQEPKVAAQAFEAGETDYAPINSDLVDKYKKDDSFKQVYDGFLFYISINFKNEDLANLNVRKAISYAINRKDLCGNVLKDGSQVAKGFIPSGLATSPCGVDFRKDSGDFTFYDKAQAQDLLNEGLKELGKSEITLRITYGTDKSPMDVFATYLQNALSKLDSIKVEMVVTTKQDRIYNKQKNGDFDLAVTRWGKGAISFDENQKAHIDKTKCVNCGSFIYFSVRVKVTRVPYSINTSPSSIRASFHI